jgi:O-antigen/teichoic acid export membrane protein
MVLPWARLRHSLVARNAVWLTIGQGGLKVLQAAYFVVIARTLGANGYGAFVAAMSLSQLVAPLAAMGVGNVLIQHVARRREMFHHYWGGAITLVFAGGAISVVAAVLAGRVFLPSTVATSLIVCIATSTLVFATLIDLCGYAYQSHERMKRTAQLPVITSLLRLIAAVVFVAAAGGHTAAQWGAYYLVCTALSAMAAVWLTSRELGRPRLGFTYTRRDLRDGFYFATGLSAASVYNDIDKTMLARLVPTLSAAGIYAAAYRVIDVLLVPIKSLGQAAYPRFFKQGAHGVRASARVSLQLLPPALSYGAVAAIAMFVLAPALPRLLGHDFDQAASAVRWLSLLPILKCTQFAAADALTGAGYQGTRTSLQVAVAAFNIAINFPLILRYSWRGAAWSSLICDGLLAVCLWALVWRLRDKGGTAGATRGGEPAAAPAVAGGDVLASTVPL